MKFRIRGAEFSDLDTLVELARQFTLLNLPSDTRVLEVKIDRSIKSFAGASDKKAAEYLFVIEAFEQGDRQVVGCSQIIAKHGTPESPHLYFKVIKKSRVSEDLGIGFIHKILRFSENSNGPTEIGGLLVDRSFRRRPEKIGKQISLIRFIYIGMNRKNFEDRVHCELAPPLTQEGRSEFWEALGRRFTGQSYQEADQISQVNKEFIRTLFPNEDIYLCLLDSKARLALGRVGQETRGAQHLLESIGFRYLNEVDPFDGGPHYGAATDEITLIQQGKWVQCESSALDGDIFSGQCLVGIQREGKFLGMGTPCEIKGEKVEFPPSTMSALDLCAGDAVFLSEFEMKSPRY